MQGYAVTTAPSFNGTRVLWAILWCAAFYIGWGFTHPVWSAQSYPNKIIRIVVPFPPGGGVDFVARIVGQRLTDNLGQPVVIDNRAGASGVRGSEVVARSSADGYTLLAVSISHAVNGSLYAKLSFDAITDFAPIAEIAFAPNVVLVPAAIPVASIEDLIRLARAQPGRLTYASAGSGSSPHLATELFKMLANVDLVHVPYSGNAAQLTAVIAGEVSMSFSSLPPSMPHVRSGKLKALAVTSATRAPIVPEIPTIAESGVKGYEYAGWYGMLAPAGTPVGVINKLNAEINNLLKSPNIREKLLADGAVPVGGTPEQFRVHLKTDVAKWAKVVKYAHMKIE